ncbi:MAG: transporter [Alcaligenaceae bacterium]|nr:MAG: transporter [Alcaligenaceae bacterium]
MTTVEGLVYGFSIALQWNNLLACFAGVLIGTVVGVLPGIGPIGAMALLLPVTYSMGPASALIMLAGIYYGSMYGGSTTSILLKVPGEVSSVITTLDGYEMARRGRAGAALFVAAIGSFVAGTVGILGLAFLAPTLASTALRFGPPEFFALCVLGLLVLSRLTDSSLARAAVMVALGLGLSTVGMEPMSGVSRFTFGSLELSQGLELVPIAIGLFGVSELLSSVHDKLTAQRPLTVRLRELLPTRAEWKRSQWPIARGSVLGFLFGLIPGPTAIIATFSSYALERKLSKHPEEFGKGAIEGVAGPESANNGAAQGAFIPLLALGIPFAPASAMLLTALLIHGAQTGPLLMVNSPEIFWGVTSSMYIGNLMLLLLNLPLIGVFVALLRLPMYFISSLVALLCLVGTYAISGSLLDLWVLLASGVAGYVLRRLKFEPAILLMALALGPILERSFLQSLYLTQGNLVEVLSRPLAGTMFALAALVLLLPLFKWLLRRKSRF